MKCTNVNLVLTELTETVLFITKSDSLAHLKSVDSRLVITLTGKCPEVLLINDKRVVSVSGDTSNVINLTIYGNVFDLTTIKAEDYPKLEHLTLVKFDTVDLTKLDALPPHVSVYDTHTLILHNHLTRNYDSLKLSRIKSLFFKVCPKPELDRNLEVLELDMIDRCNVGSLTLGGSVIPCTINKLWITETPFRCIHLHTRQVDRIDVSKNRMLQVIQVIGEIDHIRVHGCPGLRGIRFVNGVVNVLYLEHLPKLKTITTDTSVMTDNDYLATGTILNVNVKRCPVLHAPKVQTTFTLWRHEPKGSAVFFNLINNLICRALKIYNNRPEYYIGSYTTFYSNGVYEISGKDTRVIDYTDNSMVSCAGNGRACDLVSCNHCSFNKDNMVETK